MHGLIRVDAVGGDVVDRAGVFAHGWRHIVGLPLEVRVNALVVVQELGFVLKNSPQHGEALAGGFKLGLGSAWVDASTIAEFDNLIPPPGPEPSARAWGPAYR